MMLCLLGIMDPTEVLYQNDSSRFAEDWGGHPQKAKNTWGKLLLQLKIYLQIQSLLAIRPFLDSY